MSRERKIAETFVELAGTLVADFDVIDFLHQLTVRCRDIFAVADAAVLLAYPGPQLYSPAPCDPGPALSKVLELALTGGPALDAYRTSAAVSPGNLAHAHAHERAGWQDFTPLAREAGYTYASAVPLRLREETIGSLLLLRATDSPLPADDLAMAQAFADAATIGLLHARSVRHGETLDSQLSAALHSRVTIEQGKGFFAARGNISLDDAFTAMRRHARRHRLLLTDVARHVVETGSLPEPPSAASPCCPAEDASNE
ncbi:transcriptional regulator [Streptomyces longisporoflavus]|uniref:ANTAR domain-containing protein n=1 Tax=Streptomyces longisporoflavus TaxID=28044 RepID=UPI00167C9CE4|nr:ANTAR domain-containing protein [Streptomyces longisporoflavus]GGV49234.1 transcriptional regulator [Streptomyces longisporoflavus]